MLDHLMLDTLRQIAHGLAAQFGSNCEVVVHDLDPDRLDNSIVLIDNGHVSHRKQGDGPSHIVLEALKSDPAALKDKLSYLTRTHDNRILKSSTLYIRDEEAAGQSPEPESIPLNVNDLLDELISQSIKLVGKPVAMMTKDDKVKAIQFLNNAGAFLVTKSGDKVSRQFGISKYTLYSYMDASKAE